MPPDAQRGIGPERQRVMGIVGWSGSGKTTLIARLIPALVGMGVRVSTIKHAHHGFDVDQPGKDSYVHRAAGACEVMVASARRWALMHELRGEAEPSLAALLGRMAPVDLVLVEGFKRLTHRKIEVFRPSVGKPLMQPEDPMIVAVASDAAVAVGVTLLNLDDVAGIARLVVQAALPLSEADGRV